jgi:uncharacterized protein YbdZ (MbtH family)
LAAPAHHPRPRLNFIPPLPQGRRSALDRLLVLSYLAIGQFDSLELAVSINAECGHSNWPSNAARISVYDVLHRPRRQEDCLAQCRSSALAKNVHQKPKEGVGR